jgi:hypothetical protein
MARDLQHRPPLRVSELPPDQVTMYRGEARTIRCPGCHRWLKPANGGLRRHVVDIDSDRVCPQSGRRIWFDVEPAEWLADLRIATRDAAARRSARVQRKAMLPVPPPVFKLAGSCQPERP